MDPLESTRALMAEYESSVVLSSALLSADCPPGLTKDKKQHDPSETLGPVRDALVMITSLSSGASAITNNAQKQHAADGTVLTSTLDWEAVCPKLISTSSATSSGKKVIEGRREKAVRGIALHAAVKRGRDLVNEIQSVYSKEDAVNEEESTSNGETSNKEARKKRRRYLTPNEVRNKFLPAPLTSSSSMDAVFERFYQSVREAKEYHAKNKGIGGKDVMTIGRETIATFGEPRFDSYSLSSSIMTSIGNYNPDTTSTSFNDIFSIDEVFGKYLDLTALHLLAQQCGIVFNDGGEKVSIAAFYELLQSPLNVSLKCGAEGKLGPDRKRYTQFLRQMYEYLIGYFRRSRPFVRLTEGGDIAVLKDFIKQKGEEKTSFDRRWEQGTISGWESVSGKFDTSGDNSGGLADLKKFSTLKEMAESLSELGVKRELNLRRMKAGGKPSDRENRLWKARGLNEEGLAELREKEPKLFAKAKNEDGKGSAPAAVSTTSAKDLAKLECSVSALLSFLRPEVQLTARRAERRETQTIEERENEIRDETEGGLKDLAGAGGEVVEGADDSDEEEEIYNPKNLPLGWDGKPIAIWLYKLHGLNHYFECEICGGEKYRGSRAFERHFTEMNHNHGMKCLGIPNSTHFHGVTKIDDARKLWATIQAQQRERGGGSGGIDDDGGEQYEDSKGNVLTRAQYEDLARQNLL